MAEAATAAKLLGKDHDMTRLLLCTATILALTASASAQGYFGGSDGGMGRYHGVMPNPGPYRAINHDPATGRTYAREADYLTPKQARPQRIKQPRR
jgi:hypothetical protein